MPPKPKQIKALVDTLTPPGSKVISNAGRTTGKMGINGKVIGKETAAKPGDTSDGIAKFSPTPADFSGAVRGDDSRLQEAGVAIRCRTKPARVKQGQSIVQRAGGRLAYAIDGGVEMAFPTKAAPAVRSALIASGFIIKGSVG